MNLLKIHKSISNFFIISLAIININGCIQTNNTPRPSNFSPSNENVPPIKNLKKSSKKFIYNVTTDINISSNAKIKIERSGDLTKRGFIKLYSFSKSPNNKRLLSSISLTNNRRTIIDSNIETPVGVKGFVIKVFNDKNILISTQIFPKNNRGTTEIIL